MIDDPDISGIPRMPFNIASISLLLIHWAVNTGN